MRFDELKEYWESEEKLAHIKGWDFSHIDDRFTSEEDCLPWNYTAVINKYRRETDRLLDIDTGGGEFLLSLGHPKEHTTATEGFPPNVELCRRKFAELGVTFHEMTDYAKMPFPDKSFDIVINRHGSFDSEEIFRVLKPNGIFVTQQVGEDNDRELVEMLLPGTERPFPGHNLKNSLASLEKSGFTVLESGEAYRPIKFFDTGALVWFARIIEWEFAGFSVETCFDKLLRIEEEIQKNGYVSGRTHRFYFTARK